MSSSASPALGPFRGLAPYDESSASLFFGRAKEAQALFQLVTKESARVTALCGESGVGKTSLLRAGLFPILDKHSVATVYVGGYANFEQELWQALGRVRGEPPTPGESASDYLVSVARASTTGTLLVLDHLEDLVGDRSEDYVPSVLEALSSFLKVATTGSGSRLRVLLCIESASFHRLDRLHAKAGVSPAAGGWLELDRLDEPTIAEVLEQTALNTGTFFEAELSKVIAQDLCQTGPRLPADVQIVASAVVEQRLTTLRRYERAGGPACYCMVSSNAPSRNRANRSPCACCSPAPRSNGSRSPTSRRATSCQPTAWRRWPACSRRAGCCARYRPATKTTSCSHTAA